MQPWKKWSLGTFGAIVLLIGAMQVFADEDEEGEEHEGRERTAYHEGSMQGLRATNATWKAECSACHMAYPPGLLPASSWQAMMGGLDKHFGTDASLDEAAVKEILPFLEANAAPEPRKSSAEPTLRITETAWFKHEHDEISALTWKNPKIKSAANCAACHTQAEQGNFDEDTVRIPR
ncbi:diheme cytochrome c [uncultured Thiothrix sp.]|uniref:diheme cytochrome c n=1 Tax=uncultured Thiothrix sp. TaxID=223185 RepID=UPI002631F0F2|nr:diheme cytochrome c [uncultured Thiothrix sp.]